MIILRSKTKRRFSIIINIFGYSLIILLLLYILVMTFLPKKTIKIFGFQHFIVGKTSSSMYPIINPDDLIFVRKMDINNRENGDIVTFYVDVDNDGIKDVVTHFFYGEVIDDGGTYYQTKSNRSDNIDPWQLEEEDFIGKYIFRIPKVGKVIRFFHHPLGIMVLIFSSIIIVGMVIYYKRK